jgi:hypothetical protein
MDFDACPGCLTRNPRSSSVVNVSGGGCLVALVVLGILAAGVVVAMTASEGGDDSGDRPAKSGADQRERDRESARQASKTEPVRSGATADTPDVSRDYVVHAREGRVTSAAAAAVGSDDWRIQMRVLGTGSILNVEWQATDFDGDVTRGNASVPVKNGMINWRFDAPEGTQRFQAWCVVPADAPSMAKLTIQYATWPE